MRKILVIHGPNLNMLGSREPQVYGSETLNDIDRNINERARGYDLSVETFQSNSEGDLVDKIQKSINETSLIIINPAAYTHTSVAIRDALLATSIPAIEVHLSNIHKREDFRKKSLVSDIVVGHISGFGPFGYLMAVDAAADYMKGGR
ncbi:MAG: type II 3-dehydroquinate dehydratase [Deltaproteobacteria bacterium]|nr:type II 3-dehydroquinate dehydratase [Deltaproteobacteria bacterium]